MLKIGVTGGMGSGKTLVCEVFQHLGIPVFNADSESKKILDTNHIVREKLSTLLGENIFLENGAADRKKIGELVFKDPEKLRQLNSIIHPEVFKRFDEWSAALNGIPYLIKEAAILFESGSDKGLDFIISVSSPLELRLERIANRDHLSLEQIKDRMRNQWSDSERESRSDFVIINDENHLILPQIVELHRRFTKII